jgi:hypothetical protein
MELTGMATAIPTAAATHYPRSLLAGLRWRIRLYVWLEGLALAVIWLAVMFWVSLGLDYLPVLMGASEMPAAARGVLLVGTGAVLAWLLYQFVLRRTFVRMADRSMALLLERKFRGFDDSLVTAVEMAAAPTHAAAFNRDLLTKTSDEAFAAAGDVQYGRVLNYGRLNLRLLLAAALAISVGLFGTLNAAAFETATKRLYLLSSESWPRSANIRVVGIEVLRTAAPGQEAPRSVTVPFENGLVKVAKGANVQLKVEADLSPQAKVVPQQCTIYYRTRPADPAARSERGGVVMSSFRDTSEHRNFWFDNKPFKGILSTIEFDVVGYDHRVSGYRLEVVDSPAVVETLLDLTYPSYMVDEATSNFLPAIGQHYLPSGTFVPLGTKVALKFKSSKPLKQAEILDVGSGERSQIEIDSTRPDRFNYEIAALASSVTLEVSLLDVDNVTTERPYRVFLTGIEDQSPQIEVRLKGIGSAVTPEVVVPIRGKVSDDYAIHESWFDVQVNDSGDPRQLKFVPGKAGVVEQQIDFRDQRGDENGILIKPGNKLFLAVKASDKYALAAEPHVGVGDRYELEVVTADQLLAMLEVREVGLRRRFELILDELTQMRDSLLRVKSSLNAGAASRVDPEDLRGDDDSDGQPLSPEQLAQREAELRLLRVQRALQQSQKSVQEVQGVAAGFLDIREELINNRVDTEDRKNRLKEQIADPLNKTCAEAFPSLDQRLAAVETLLRGAGVGVDKAQAAPLADEAIDQANVVLTELEEVLAKMQDLETYNELLEIVRDLLKDQEKLIERTQQERKRQTLEELK